VELDMVLSRLDRDISGRQKLARYVMIGECLRTGRAMPDPLDLAERVRESLRTEDAPVVAGRPSGFVRRRYAGLAAGLAAGMILAMVIMAGPGWWQQNSVPVVAAVADSADFPEGSLELTPPRDALSGGPWRICQPHVQEQFRFPPGVGARGASRLAANRSHQQCPLGLVPADMAGGLPRLRWWLLGRASLPLWLMSRRSCCAG